MSGSITYHGTHWNIEATLSHVHKKLTGYSMVGTSPQDCGIVQVNLRRRDDTAQAFGTVCIIEALQMIRLAQVEWIVCTSRAGTKSFVHSVLCTH